MSIVFIFTAEFDYLALSFMRKKTSVWDNSHAIVTPNGSQSFC